MGLGAKKPKPTAAEKALESAQLREISRQDAAINEKRSRILRAQTGSRASLLSGSERGVKPGEQRLSTGSTSASGMPGRAGMPKAVGLAGGAVARVANRAKFSKANSLL